MPAAKCTQQYEQYEGCPHRKLKGRIRRCGRYAKTGHCDCKVKEVINGYLEGLCPECKPPPPKINPPKPAPAKRTSRQPTQKVPLAVKGISCIIADLEDTKRQKAERQRSHNEATRGWLERERAKSIADPQQRQEALAQAPAPQRRSYHPRTRSQDLEITQQALVDPSTEAYISSTAQAQQQGFHGDSFQLMPPPLGAITPAPLPFNQEIRPVNPWGRRRWTPPARQYASTCATSAGERFYGSLWVK